VARPPPNQLLHLTEPQSWFFEPTKPSPAARQVSLVVGPTRNRPVKNE